MDFMRELEPSVSCAPEAGWVLAAHAHGKGFATEAMLAALVWRDSYVAGDETYCLINPGNSASVRVAGKCGFEMTGVVGYKGHEVRRFVRGRI